IVRDSMVFSPRLWRHSRAAASHQPPASNDLPGGEAPAGGLTCPDGCGSACDPLCWPITWAPDLGIGHGGRCLPVSAVIRRRSATAPLAGRARPAILPASPSVPAPDAPAVTPTSLDAMPSPDTDLRQINERIAGLQRAVYYLIWKRTG